MSLPRATLQRMEPAILGLAVLAILVLGLMLYVATIPIVRSRALWYWHSGDDSADRHAAGRVALRRAPRQGVGAGTPRSMDSAASRGVRAARGEPHCGERQLRDELAGPPRSTERSVAGLVACPRESGTGGVVPGRIRAGMLGARRPRESLRPRPQRLTRWPSM
jgi:hypothetical protein